MDMLYFVHYSSDVLQLLSADENKQTATLQRRSIDSIFLCEVLRACMRTSNTLLASKALAFGALINCCCKECEYDPLIILSTRLKNFSFAKFLIVNGADVNRVDKHGMSALYYAAEYGDKHFVKYLLNHRNVIVDHSKRLSPLYVAICCNNLEAFNALIESGKFSDNEIIEAKELKRGCILLNDYENYTGRFKGVDMASSAINIFRNVMGPTHYFTIRELIYKAFDYNFTNDIYSNLFWYDVFWSLSLNVANIDERTFRLVVNRFAINANRYNIRIQSKAFEFLCKFLCQAIEQKGVSTTNCYKDVNVIRQSTAELLVCFVSCNWNKDLTILAGATVSALSSELNLLHEVCCLRNKPLEDRTSDINKTIWFLLKLFVVDISEKDEKGHTAYDIVLGRNDYKMFENHFVCATCFKMNTVKPLKCLAAYHVYPQLSVVTNILPILLFKFTLYHQIAKH